MLTAMLASTVTEASAATSAAGSVNFMRTAEGSFDGFTASPTVAQQEWMKAHYWRMRAYAPYFDSRLAWSSKAWAYQSAYAIYPGSAVDVQHPEWILRDAAGNKLYIPFACSGGKCSQYAADIGNPAYRRWWLDQSRAKLAKGYAGLYFDDVNLYRKVSNGSGAAVAPIDPRTGAAMSESTWQHYLADQLEAARTAFPTTEIVHNAIWFAGDTSVDQLRVQRSADLVNLERGVNDAGLTGGTGKWSLQALLGFADRRHAEGHAVVFDATSTTAAGRLYGLAAYFLISSGRDGLGNNQGGTPTDWWTGYDVALGGPLAGRYSWNGLLRRDFENGYTLVNEPGAPTRTVTLPAGSRDLTGTTQDSETLTAASGAVFTTSAPPAAAATTTFTVPRTPAAHPTAAAHRAQATASSPASAAASASASPAAVAAARSFTLKVAVLPAARAASRSGRVALRHVRISGRLRSARGGRMDIVVRSRTSNRRVRHVRSRTRNGRFARVLPRMRPGRYKVSVTYRVKPGSVAQAARSFAVPR
jgi:Hypothetical glycosyl hydrolase family 15